MKIKTLILSLSMSLLALLTACSKPRDEVIPQDMATWEKSLAPSIQKLSEEDRKLFLGYVMRAKMGEVFGGKGVPMGTTVGQAIEDQKAFQTKMEVQAAEAEALKKKLESERSAAQAQMAGAVIVTLLEKSQLSRDYDARRYNEVQVFRVGIRNASDKELRGVSGTLEFINIFEKKVGTVNFEIAQSIKPGKDFVWTGSRDYNQFLDEHKALWNLEEGKYTTRFIPEALIYADGTKVIAPR